MDKAMDSPNLNTRAEEAPRTSEYIRHTGPGEWVTVTEFLDGSGVFSKPHDPELDAAIEKLTRESFAEVNFDKFVASFKKA